MSVLVPRLALSDAAYRRGWLLRATERKVRFLIERGIHPEQALLGTGLLTLSQYVELVEGAFGLTLERLDQDRWSARGVSGELPEGVEAAVSEEGEAGWLVSDPWEDAVSVWRRTVSGPMYFVFRSDLLRWRRRSEPTDFAVSAWWRMWQGVGITEARICVEQGAGHVWVGPDAEPASTLALAKEEVPALQTWFEAGFPRQAWKGTRILGVEGDLLEVVAHEAAHPLARLAGWQEFLRKPRGILVCLAPDAWLEARLAAVPEVADPHHLFAHELLRRIHPRDPQGRELASQAALAGVSFCWMEDAPEETAWIRPLAQAGVPVLVVRRRETLHGSAWEAYHLSYEPTRPAARR